MLLTQPGSINERLYLLGTRQNIFYLVKGKVSMLIGGGMNWIAPELERQFSDFEINLAEIEYLVVQHSHFDHCGLVPYLKRKLPQMKILGTESSRNILARQVTVDDNTMIDIGEGLTVKFIETPGHSPCAVSVYVPDLKAIFPTDSAPCPLDQIDDLVRPSPQYDFNLYRRSLKKLLDYDIEICGFDHSAAVIGDDARKVLQNGLTLCDEYSNQVIQMYQQSGDIETLARQVASRTIVMERTDLISEDVMVPVARAEERNILRAAGITVG
jgi:glyoxylase-like metal-dependent hydrolase (beta-lactamase superfamily II)